MPHLDQISTQFHRCYIHCHLKLRVLCCIFDIGTSLWFNFHCAQLLNHSFLALQTWSIDSTQFDTHSTGHFPESLARCCWEVYRFNFDVLILNVLEQAAGWGLHHPEEQHHKHNASTVDSNVKPTVKMVSVLFIR